MPAKPKASTKRTSTRKAPPTPKAPTSKKDLLIALLREKDGRDVSQLSEALGWLPHSVRAAIVGLRKSGLEVERLAKDKTRALRYRISAKTGATS